MVAVGDKGRQVPAAPAHPGREPRLTQPRQLLRCGTGDVLHPVDEREGVRGVLRHDEIGEHEPTAGSEHLRDATEERGLGRTRQVVYGEGGDNEIVRTVGQWVLQALPEPRGSRRVDARRRRSEHVGTGVKPDQFRFGVGGKNAARGLAAPAAQVQHPAYVEIAAGVDQGTLETVVVGDLRMHHCQEGVRLPLELRHWQPTLSSVVTCTDQSSQRPGADQRVARVLPTIAGMTQQTPGLGRARQEIVYRSGVLGRRPRVPTNFTELERRARKAMSRRAWAYVYGGAGDGATMAANRAAFDRWQIVPRMLRDVSERDLSTTVLGTRMDVPLLLAPVGAAGLVRADADVLIGRAAAEVGVPYIVSSQGSSPMETTASAMGESPRWFQLYWSRDEALVDSFLRRAEASGAQAVVVTVDTTLLGWRPWDLNIGSLPFSQGVGIAQYTSDPRFTALVRERLAEQGPPKKPDHLTLGALRSLLSVTRHHPGRLWANLRSPAPRAAVETFLDVYSNPALNWDHLATLRDRTRLPVVLKGLLHPDDARRALDLGVDALMVSNHGGRQVDGVIGALDAMVAIRDAVGTEPTIVFDSGIRSGADIFKALALGADAVTVGRPHLYGLALDGQQGVVDVLRNLIAELDLTMALSGVRDRTGLDGTTIQRGQV